MRKYIIAVLSLALVVSYISSFTIISNHRQYIKTTNNLNRDLLAVNHKLFNIVDSLLTVPELNNVTVSVYHPTRRQTDSTPNQVADGTLFRTSQASKYRFIAVSRDMLAEHGGGPFQMGDVVLIYNIGPRSGIYQIRDKMGTHSIFKGPITKQIDILETQGTGLFYHNNGTIRLLYRSENRG